MSKPDQSGLSRDENTRWHQQYERLRVFLDQHDRLPNTLYATREEQSLRTWCNAQQAAHYGRGRVPLDKEREALLEQLPLWRW